MVRQFEDTINNMDDVYIKTDKKFRYTQVSSSIKKYLEIDSLDKVIGKPLSEYWEITNNEIKELSLIALRNKVIQGVLFKYKTQNGKIKYGKMNARALFENNKFNGIEGIIRDVTNDIESQKKIKELSIQKEVLINNIPSSIYYKDINLRYLEVNNHFAQLLGKTTVEIIGKTDKEVASKQITYEYEELDKKVIKTKKPIFDYVKKYINKDGNEYWVSTSKLPYLDSDNNVLGIIGVVRDITKQIKHEKEIQESKNKIERAHKDIIDNINYAKKIQQALLSSNKVIATYLSEYFVFFKPKEQVSGDFYYFKKFNKHVIFAAADCTGHGVSGAFLTILGITHLNEIVSKRNIKNPAKALNVLREKIKDTYKLFGTETKDGLDIALCALNTETNILSYAGAFNPLWIIRKGELIEYKATRNPIGFYFNEIDFENHEIQLQKDDIIYIFSDGFVDQFGGEYDKKYTAKRFKNFLLSISKLPMSEQKEKLSTEFNIWKGNKEQTDDVTIFGIKI